VLLEYYYEGRRAGHKWAKYAPRSRRIPTEIRGDQKAGSKREDGPARDLAAVEGGYTIGRGADGELRFYDPRGRQLHNRSDLAASGGAEALRQRHRDLGIDIVPDTIIGNYCGDRLDMAYAVSVLTRQNVPAGTSTARGAEKR
jgi:hypothetical protein